MAKKPQKAPPVSEKNLYCRLSDLSNEASVEQFFVSRMLEDLGYRDNQIKPKETLDKLATPGRRKPDVSTGLCVGGETKG